MPGATETDTPKSSSVTVGWQAAAAALVVTVVGTGAMAAEVGREGKEEEARDITLTPPLLSRFARR